MLMIEFISIIYHNFTIILIKNKKLHILQSTMPPQIPHFSMPSNLIGHISLTYQLKLQNQVGYGLTSHVYKAFKTESENIPYAVKVFDFSGNNISSHKQRLKLQYQIEVNVLNLFKAQDGIVQIYNHGVFQDYAYIIMEYIDGYSLRDVAETMAETLKIEKQQRKIKEREDSLFGNLQNVTGFKQKIVIWIAQLILILQKLSAYGIIHRDLKLENLMIDHHSKLKIIDFGSVQLQPNYEKVEHLWDGRGWEQIIKLNEQLNGRNDYMVGSRHYICPELISGKRNRIISPKMDIWSLGIIAYRLLCGKYPFEDAGSGLFRKIRQEQPEIGEQLPQQEAQLIRSCLKKNPYERPSFRQLKNMKYFSSQNRGSANRECSTSCHKDSENQKVLLQLKDKNITFISQKIVQTQQVSTLTNLSENQNGKSAPQAKIDYAPKLRKYKNVGVKLMQQRKKKELILMLGGGRVCKSNVQDLKISKNNDHQVKMENKSNNQIFQLRFITQEELQQFLCFIMEEGTNQIQKTQTHIIS